MKKSDKVKEALDGVIDAWESLRGGRTYSNEDIQDWLIDKMGPAINKARKVLGRSAPK